jgi:hypothetical protein
VQLRTVVPKTWVPFVNFLNSCIVKTTKLVRYFVVGRFRHVLGVEESIKWKLDLCVCGYRYKYNGVDVVNDQNIPVIAELDLN